MIMGLAVHLLGDTFAHRTMVPKDAESSFASSNFTSGDWNGFKARLADYVIEFRDIKTYSDSGLNSVYEDNTSFYSNRYNATKKTVKNLITLYNGDKVFDLGKIISGFGFLRKLNNFQGYADSAGCGIDVSDYSTEVFRVDHPDKGVKDNEKDYVDYIPYHLYTP